MKRLALLVSAVWLVVPALAAAQTQNELEAGGLKPPEAVEAEPDPNQPESSPEEDLERADEEDSGRGLEWVWLNAEIGAQHLGLQTFKANDLVDAELTKTTQTGLLYGAGIGVRLLVFTLGARFRLGSFSAFQIWTLDAEGAMHIPLGRIEPYFTIGAGYASLGSFSASSPTSSKADVKGFNGRLGFGIDIYLTNTFSVGGNLSGDLLFLSRAKVAGANTSSNPSEAAIYARDGSSIGAAASLTGVLGLHF